MAAKPIPKLKKEAATQLQKLVRLKAAVAANRDGMIQCVTCGSWNHYKSMDAGHFIERGKILLVEENIHPQCPPCNRFRMKVTTTVLKYRNFMAETYGEDFIEELERLAFQPQKHTRGELEDMISEWKGLVKKLESQV